ncbi:MAG: phosphoenolpyruvate--protein phosphotransferase [Desulfuromonadales bacterium]|nr:phosphoenolpyruvate--protein phosphotransferase [Desulfuromonadales bacterium]
MPINKTENFGISTLEDISALILQSHDLEETLGNIVALVAKRMGTEVCSIYLFDDDGETLRLQASKGLSPRSVGKVSMKLGEGLTGLAVEERRVVSIPEPHNHPRYRYFKETGEERYHSFLGIPLFDRKNPIGVIVIQTKEPRTFTNEEISALSTIAFQIASIVINARLLYSIGQKEEESRHVALELEKARSTFLNNKKKKKGKESQSILRGTVAYPGLATGPAHVLDERLGFTDILDDEWTDPDFELKRLESALEKTRIETIYLEKQVAERLSEDDAAIFHTHLMILEDRGFIEKLRREIEQGRSAQHALKTVAGEYIEAFSRMEDSYLRERAVDMEDIARRLHANILGNEHQPLQLKHAGVLVARSLLPSDMATLDHSKVRGIVTEVGEMNSHAVIMAKSLGIPALVGVFGVVQAVRPDDHLILDTNSGCLYINPPRHIVTEYLRIERDRDKEEESLDGFREQLAVTNDGERVCLRANVGLVSDIGIAVRNGAEGIGLYRTEFPYMTRSSFPSRHDQYLLYRRMVEGFAGQPVTIRTLDIGGDKALPYFPLPKEDNPFMGWRSVRVSLDYQDIFRTQIEAILMAAMHGNVKLLFPMISGVEEILSCRKIVEEAAENLRREGIPFSETVPIGIMIEVPAAVQLIGMLAKHVDFFALGTNDLVQYMLAADRNNPLVKNYYDPFHPAVLHALRHVADVARTHNKGLCICGEMATDPQALLFLIGIGVREMSMAAPYIPKVKQILSTLNTSSTRKIAKEILTLENSSKIRQHLGAALMRSKKTTR